MVYAEKLLISKQDQISPMHTHVIKSEDIINRGGATLVVELNGSDDAAGPSEDRSLNSAQIEVAQRWCTWLSR